MKNNKDTDNEKRQSIRIKDRVLLSFKEISEERYRQRLDEYMEGMTDPWIESSHPTVRKGIKKHLKKLKEKDPDLAAILEILDQKLNLVLSFTGSEDSMGNQNQPARLYRVDLSAKGIGFVSENPLEPDTLLELYMGLLPEHYFFSCFGQVVRTNEKNGRNFTAIKFIWITEDDQEKLIEHIFSRQVLQLRMRRKKKEENKK